MAEHDEQELKTRLKKTGNSESTPGNTAVENLPEKTRIRQNVPSQTGNKANTLNQNVPRQTDTTRFKPQNRSLDNPRSSSSSSKTRIKQSQQATVAGVNTPAGARVQVLKGRFLLEKVLGVGGMGVVYRAKDRLKVEAKDRDPYVAIKVLSEEFKSHPEAFIALQRESRKAQRIAHPNVVKVYDFDRDGDVVFMTMEYMEGRPLDQMIKQYHSTGLPRDDAWNILSGLCSAISHAHNENIVHSDFKPGNVFVTDSGIAKIFDFGIARAVASVDRVTGKVQDRTVFDAGTLGALTPAYASLEMLLGKTPDIRDDIYALGCITYEILTGDHPFNRIPADEAYNKNLKPRRITDISKRQWRAIEKALAFKREDRIESVEEFHHQLTTKNKPKYLIAASFFIVIGLSVFAYYSFFQKNMNSLSQSDMRDELKFEIRYNLYSEKIKKLLSDPTFTVEWEESIWDEMRGVYNLLNGEPDSWVLSARNETYKLYINKIKELMSKKEFTRASEILANAYRYTDDSRLLDNEKTRLSAAIREQDELNRRLAAEQKARLQQTFEIKTEKQNKTNLFNLALKNVNQQLECGSRLNMRDFKIAITKLRSLDLTRYNKMEPSIVHTLAQCITTIGKNYPERAFDDRKYALRIFVNNPEILAIDIRARDACDISIAGLGARGDRATCRDKLAGGGAGPPMVVIPGDKNIRPFAIGKYEVSNREYAIYCKETGACSVRSGRDSMPTTDITIASAKSYLKWLSNKTKQHYRLPTHKEWLYAANSRSSQLDPNRNCQLSSRGIQKGGDLVRINTGKQNSWGLVNYVGNVQEWVYSKGHNLMVAGGSYQTPMDNCTTTIANHHTGGPDEKTGFRVVRELTR